MVGFGSPEPTFFVGPSDGNSTGKVGVGIYTMLQAKFHVFSDGNTPGAEIDVANDLVKGLIIKSSNTNETNFLVYGSGKVYAREVTVQLTTFPDYVFNKKYKLMPLNELDKFIIQNKHLPNVLPAESIVKNGLNLGDMDATLMQKVEELTLYIIELNKQMEQLKKDNEVFQAQLKSIKK